MNILLVKAHPLKSSLCELFTEKATNCLASMGHEVTLEDLYQDQFDPLLSIEERVSYYKSPYDASEVADEIQRLKNADALVIIFPTWWFGFPAILKGWFDRVWAPTAAYDHAGDFGPIRPKLNKLKKTFIITTLGAPWWVDYFILWRPVKRTLRWAILGACARQCKLKYLSFYKCEALTQHQVDRHVLRIESELREFFPI